MSRILFVLAVVVAVLGALAAFIAPVDTLSERDAYFARLILFGPAVLVSLILFAFGAVVLKLTRLETQNEELLDRLAAAFPEPGAEITPRAPRQPIAAPQPVIEPPATAEPSAPPFTMPAAEPATEAAPSESRRPSWLPKRKTAPAAETESAAPAAVAAAATATAAAVATPAVARTEPPALPDLAAPVPEPVLPTPQPSPATEPALTAAPLAEPVPEAPAEAPAGRRFRFGRLGFGKPKAEETASADVPSPATPEPATAAAAPVLPDLVAAPAPRAMEPALPNLEPPAERPAPTTSGVDDDSLAARLSAALMAANSADTPARPVEPDWPEFDRPTREDRASRIGADALSEALLGASAMGAESAAAASAASAPALPVASPLPVPEPAPEPIPAPAPESAPMAPMAPPAPIADAAPPATAEPGRAPTVAEYMARAEEAEPTTPAPRVMREGQFAGRKYRMFEDGSLEIFTEQSTLRFDSLEEFRSFVASGGRRPEGQG